MSYVDPYGTPWFQRLDGTPKGLLDEGSIHPLDGPGTYIFQRCNHFCVLFIETSPVRPQMFASSWKDLLYYIYGIYIYIYILYIYIYANH